MGIEALRKIDHIDRMITLTMITLSGIHYNRFKRMRQQQQPRANHSEFRGRPLAVDGQPRPLEARRQMGAQLRSVAHQSHVPHHGGALRKTNPRFD